MSSLLWTCVLVVLAMELLVLSAFVAPLPWGVRKNVTRFFQRPAVEMAFQRVLRYIGFGLTLAIVESINALKILRDRLDFVADEPMSAESPVGMSSGPLSMQDFRWQNALSQRNLYLSGFCLVLLVTLSRIIELVSNETALRDKIKRLNSELEKATGQKIQKANSSGQSKDC